eukprot:TRINITY_DN10090_c0_g1_i2.p1 TRINITY_DN10090_c0_g1~~TRINITY_DN10090_c0_g1_i2.p1  ORF type:complete len:101 (+),score=16.43 TRINITY_DN10090_c0_g1_i2:313-615(+)
MQLSMRFQGFAVFIKYNCLPKANPMYSALIPVSYTHLTLPTILLVQISVVAVSLKKKKKRTYNDYDKERKSRTQQAIAAMEVTHRTKHGQNIEKHSRSNN